VNPHGAVGRRIEGLHLASISCLPDTM
jgi:hypothetical protein